MRHSNPVTARGPTQTQLSVPVCLQRSVSLCGKLCSSVSENIKHLKTHIREGSFIVCTFFNCSASYNILSSFWWHVTRHHGASACNITSLVQNHQLPVCENQETAHEEELNCYLVMNSGNDNVVLDAPAVLAESTVGCIDSTKIKLCNV